VKTAQRRRILFGDDHHCPGCGTKSRRLVIDVPGADRPVEVKVCPRCDGREYESGAEG